VSQTPSHVIFDLDGTLADSSPGIFASFAHTLGQLGRQADTETLRSLIGPPLRVSFAMLGFPDDECDGAVAIYREFYARTGVYDAVLYPTIRTTLDTLRASGISLGIATGKRVDFAQEMVHDQGLEGYFDVIAGASEDYAVSEKFDIVQQVLHHWSVAPSLRVWMVGDRRFDVEAAVAHGLLPVGVTWGFGSREELAEAGAPLILDEPAALLTLAGLSAGA